MIKKRMPLYRIADAFYAVFLLSIVAYQKLTKVELASKEFNIAITLIFLGVYLLRYFFRPSYQDVVLLRQKSKRIEGYYSRKALTSEEIYLDSYSFWIKISLITFLAYILLCLLVVLSYPDLTANKHFILVHMAIIGSLQILAWYLTHKREQQKWR